MAWKAKLQSIQDNPVPNDTININIEFHDDATGRSFVKGYNLHASNIQQLKDAQDIFESEVLKLIQFDSVVSIIKNQVGKDIA